MLWRDENTPEFDPSDDILCHQEEASKTCINNTLVQPEERNVLLPSPTSQGENFKQQTEDSTTPQESSLKSPNKEKVLYPARPQPAFSLVKRTDDKSLIIDPASKPKCPVGRPKNTHNIILQRE